MATLPRMFRSVFGAGASVCELIESSATQLKDSSEDLFEMGNNLLKAGVKYTDEWKQKAEASNEAFDKERYKKDLMINQRLESAEEFKKATSKVLNCSVEEVTADKIEAVLQEYDEILNKVKL